MTIRDLQKVITEPTTEQQTELFSRIRDKPFWVWSSKEEHKQAFIDTNGECCFNHIIGLPQKDGKSMPLFEYEKTIYESLFAVSNNHFTDRHLWIKKATGLGITEFFLRLIVWLCLRNDEYHGSDICILTGPSLDLAIKLIRRIKNLFQPHNIYFDDYAKDIVELNGCRIQCYPSHHLASYRSLVSPKFILLDEADFFPTGQQQEARDVSERYIAKSDPYIVLVSTPNAPGQLFDKIEQEPADSCIYKRLKLDYSVGLNNIYSETDIAKAKQSPSFPREYNLFYGGLIGNVFHTSSIDEAIARPYNVEYINPFSNRAMGIDPGFASSAFAITVTQFNDNRIEVLYSEEFERVDFIVALQTVEGLYDKYKPMQLFVDGSAVSFIRSIKASINDIIDFERIVSECHRDKIDPSERMIVVPISFSLRHREMLANAKMIVESEQLAIDPRFDKLILSLRTAVGDSEGKLLKEMTSFDDVLDSFRLALQAYHYS